MNFNRQKWIIPRNFSDPTTISLISELEAKLSKGNDKYIYCPKIFNGSESNQTRLLKQRFLNLNVKHCSSESNPDEIELDL